MNIKKTFLQLTKKTYPHGHEEKLKGFLPNNILTDKHGNYYLKIGESETIFACHLDTVSKEHTKVKHIFDENFIKTNGKTTLGADDKAGVTILLYMIEEKVPGLYYFFLGEEVGCIGSKAAVKSVDFTGYKRIISFDRKDICSVITHQGWERCCSDEFANALSKEYCDLGLELKPDDTGVGTDSAQFTDLIPECTNLSVGYYNEHTHEEKQDIIFLEKMCMASVIIDWETLPTTRDTKEKEYKGYESSFWRNSSHDMERARRWNDRNENRNRNRIHGPILPQFSNLSKAYGYEIDDECPIDAAFELDLKNKKHQHYYTGYNKDVFAVYRDNLLDMHFSIRDYGLIEEQYVNFFE